MAEIRSVTFNPDTLKVEIEDVERRRRSDCESFPPDFGLFYATCVLISIVSFSADILMHCWLAYLFHLEGRVAHSCLTVAFIIFPSVVSTGFSMRWYILDEDNESSPAKSSIVKWCIRISTMLLQITLIHRYCDTLLYGIRSFLAGLQKQQVKQDSLYRKMLAEDGDAALLRLFYCVLNSGPQAVLQMTILLHQTIEKLKRCPIVVVKEKCLDDKILEYQYISVGLSVFSVAWTLTVYDRTVHHIREDKKRLSFFGTLLNFMSQFTWAVSRILALSVLAVLSTNLALLGYVAHATLMSIWLLLRPDPNHSQCDECVLNCMLGVAYIFVYISSHTEPLRYSYSWYYVTCFAENICCLLAWYQYMSVPQVYVYRSLIWIQISAFFSSLFFLILYYNCFHPNRKAVCSRRAYQTESSADSCERIDSL